MTKLAAREFSVYQFFADGSQEYVLRFVPAEEAVVCASGLCKSVGALLGTTVRVIITDGGDCCCFEWEREKGVVYPEEMKTHAGFPHYSGKVTS